MMVRLTKLKGNLVLFTDSYSKEDVLQLIFILTNKFNLSSGIISLNKKGKNSYRIRINKSSLPHLFGWINQTLCYSIYAI